MQLEVLIGVAIGLAQATASTVTLPLRSRAREHQAHGDLKYRLAGSRRYLNTSSGVDVPVTDWFNRTDNQVRFNLCSSSLDVVLATINTF